MAIKSDARRTLRNGRSALVLLITDLLHPLDRLAVERLLDGDMRHSCGGPAPCQCFSPAAKTTTSPG